MILQNEIMVCVNESLKVIVETIGLAGIKDRQRRSISPRPLITTSDVLGTYGDEMKTYGAIGRNSPRAELTFQARDIPIDQETSPCRGVDDDIPETDVSMKHLRKRPCSIMPLAKFYINSSPAKVVVSKGYIPWMAPANIF